jgi:hypothetical protein
LWPMALLDLDGYYRPPLREFEGANPGCTVLMGNRMGKSLRVSAKEPRQKSLASSFIN